MAINDELKSSKDPELRIALYEPLYCIPENNAYLKRTAYLPRKAVLFIRTITLGTKKLPGKDQKWCYIPKYGH